MIFHRLAGKGKLIIGIVLFSVVFGAGIFAQGGWTDGGATVRLTTSSDRVGIGVTSTNSSTKLQVNGGALIGYSSTTLPAPSNGLFVSGQVGIGTTSPASGSMLHVNGTLRANQIIGNNVFPVTAYGAIPNDGVNDQAAFESALSAASIAGGGTVLVPPGRFRINGTLVIPEGVTLKGSWETPNQGQINRGSVLEAYSGRDNENGAPFITISKNTALIGFTVFYPEQNQITNIRPYPYTISLASAVNLTSVSIVNVTLSNSYNGIRLTANHAGHLLQGVNMCALNRGISIGTSTDFGVIDNCHIHNRYWWEAFNVFYTDQQNQLRDYTITHLIAFDIGRVDWEEITNSFAIWARIGFLFNAVPGQPHDPKANVLVTNSGIDISEYAVWVNECKFDNGISFQNCQFIGTHYINSTNIGPVKYTNCFFGGMWDVPIVPLQTAIFVNSGSNILSLSSCHFWGWDHPLVGHACITCTNDSRTVVSNCSFRENSQKQHFNLFNNSQISVLGCEFGGWDIHWNRENVNCVARFFGNLPADPPSVP